MSAGRNSSSKTKSAFPKNTAVVRINMYCILLYQPWHLLYSKDTAPYELLFPAAVAWISFGMAFVFFHF
ncbi:hypothetical protein QW060_23590 [Myroides ceti]|uniref:Uncharacterized protein n=1 Tax=Paenimyroides ceti TaxID=395087 RepID=A0ABT8D343_9FLAO|nr:hypothetical protein [Paenimyroides ceti]MDN3709900.1 hypothetical protein [Paenimyroides ceti]